MHKITLPGHGPYYIFGCGHFCHVIMAGKNIKGPRLCPCCGAPLTGKFFTCDVCCRPVIAKPRTVHCKYCEDCRYDQKLKLNRKSFPMSCETEKTLSAKTDCIFYESVCLPNAAFNNKKHVPCHGCKDYQPVPLHATIRVGDSFAVTDWGNL